jgi:hypothetical protein
LHKARTERIGHQHKNNGQTSVHHDRRGRRRAADHNIRPHGNNLIRSDANLIKLSAWPAICEFDIAAQFPAEFSQPAFKGGNLSLPARIIGQKAAHQHGNAPFLLARLRVHRKRTGDG